MTRLSYHITLFATAFLFFAIVAPMGNLPSDTEYSVATATSLVLHGSLSLPPDQRLRDAKTGVNSRRYSKYGAGYALLFTPAIAFSELASRIAPVRRDYIEQFVLSFANTFFSAIIIVLFFMIFSGLGYSKRSSLAAVACIAAGSLLLPYSKIVHAEIPTALLLLLFIMAIINNPRLDLKNGIMFGCVAGAMVLIKAGNAPYAFIIGLYGIWLFFRKEGTVAGFASFAGCAVFFAGILLVLNCARFGDPFNTGYGAEQYLFTTPLLTGLAGLLFSPSKSLFLFSPLAIACAAVFPRFYKKFPEPAILVAAMAILPILFYARWHDWHGGWAWGPRLVVPAVLLLHLALPEVFLALKNSRPGQMLFAALLAAAVAVSLLGSLVWYQQVCHFHRDYSSIRYSEPAAAVRLLANKLRNGPEVYSCADFGLDAKNNDYAAIFKVAVRGDSLDFSSFEKFQGLSTMWDGGRRNFHAPFLWVMPVVLSLFSIAGFSRLWRRSYGKK